MEALFQVYVEIKALDVNCIEATIFLPPTYLTQTQK